MPEQVTKIRVFLASPGDVADERERLLRVVDGLNRTLGQDRSLVLELLRWETHAWPGFGDDAQDVINRELDPYDVFVGVMWKRLGTPTHRADSGTVEEFERAYALWSEHGIPLLMFYFSRAPFFPSAEEMAQLQSVLDFRAMLQARGGLCWDYETPERFEALVREHLYQQVIKLLDRRPPRLARQQHDEPSSKLARPPVDAFPVPDSPAEDVLEGMVDAVNAGGYGFTLGQDYLSVATPTAARQWGGYYSLKELRGNQWYKLKDKRGFELPIAVERDHEGFVRIVVDAAVLDRSLPVVESLAGY